MALSGSCSRGGAWSWPISCAHQPVGEIVEIVQPLAQIGVGGAQHAGAGVGLHALDAGLGGQAGAAPPRACLCSQPWSWANMR